MLGDYCLGSGWRSNRQISAVPRCAGVIETVWGYSSSAYLTTKYLTNNNGREEVSVWAPSLRALRLLLWQSEPEVADSTVLHSGSRVTVVEAG